MEKARVIDPFGHAGFDPSGRKGKILKFITVRKKFLRQAKIRADSICRSQP